jgi:hypothetical protein
MLISINKKIKQDFQEKFTVIGKNQLKINSETKKKVIESDKKQPVKVPVVAVTSSKTRNTNKEISSKKIHLRTESTNVNSNSSNKDDSNTSYKYNFSKSKTIRNYSVSIVNKLGLRKKIETSNSDNEESSIKRNLSAKNNKERFENIENENLNSTIEEVKVSNVKSTTNTFVSADSSKLKSKVFKKINYK